MKVELRRDTGKDIFFNSLINFEISGYFAPIACLLSDYWKKTSKIHIAYLFLLNSLVLDNEIINWGRFMVMLY